MYDLMFNILDLSDRNVSCNNVAVLLEFVLFFIFKAYFLNPSFEADAC